MASGPEHYQKAEELQERCLAELRGIGDSAPPSVIESTRAAVSDMMKHAQVHALLAVAASNIDAYATALNDVEKHQERVASAWSKVLKGETDGV